MQRLVSPVQFRSPSLLSLLFLSLTLTLTFLPSPVLSQGHQRLKINVYHCISRYFRSNWKYFKLTNARLELSCDILKQIVTELCNNTNTYQDANDILYTTSYDKNTEK